MYQTEILNGHLAQDISVLKYAEPAALKAYCERDAEHAVKVHGYITSFMQV